MTAPESFTHTEWNNMTTPDEIIKELDTLMTMLNPERKYLKRLSWILPMGFMILGYWTGKWFFIGLAIGPFLWDHFQSIFRAYFVLRRLRQDLKNAEEIKHHPDADWQERKAQAEREANA